MHEIDLRKIDLNLLVVFDTLMRQRSVSKAAVALNRTQSAVSHALERLRQQLQDPLLVRQGGQMVPSPKALQLRAQLHPLLRQMAQILAPQLAFEPTTTTRRFRLAMRDFLGGLFADLLYQLHQQAPQAQLDWLAVPGQVFDALAAGELDLFIGPASMPVTAGIDSEPIGALHWACYARSGHPAIAQWNAQAWGRWPHVQVGVTDTVRNPVSQAAQQAGVTRQVAVSVPQFSAVAPVLANSDLLATLPRAVIRDQLHH